MIYIYELIISIISSLGFALVFSVPKNALLVASINGGLCWVIYRIVLDLTGDVYLSSFIAAFIISAVSERHAVKFKHAASIFIFPGIINLCPGESIYNTMSYFVKNQTDAAILSLYKSIAIAGAIAFGVLLASSFSTSLKNYRTRTTQRTLYKRSNK